MNKLRPHDFVMLRRPLLPITHLTRINGQIKKDPNCLQNALIKIYRTPILREALYLASPGLYQQLLQTENFADQPAERKVLISLYKYLVRATSRCTPFGLLAGYCVLSVGDQTEIEFDGKYKKHTTLGAQVLQVIGERVSKTSKEPLLWINSSMHAVGSDFRFFSREIATASGAFALIAKQLKSDRYFESVLIAAASGATPTEILRALVLLGVSEDDAGVYIQRLVEEHVLVGAMQPLQSNSRFQNLIELLLHRDSPEAKILALSRAQISEKRDGPEWLEKVEDSLKAASIDTADALQIDLEFKTKAAKFNQKITCAIIADVSKVLSLQENSMSAALRAFATRFYNRYGQRRVPLMQALDPDSGIGYGSHETLPFGHFELPAKQAHEAHLKSPYAVMLERIYLYTQTHKSHFYILGQKELGPLQQTPLKVAEGFSLIGSLVCASQRQADIGEYFFDCSAAAGPGSMGLISRFADADNQLASYVQAAKAKETTHYQGSVLAEVQYVPPGRQANLTRRPALGDYQIPAMSAPVEGPTTIHLSDLLVSIESGEVVIYSRTLCKRVRPRATTAYNPKLGPPVYQFLTDVASAEGAPSRLWDWGHLSNNTFLPRIQVGKTIISKAYWNLPAETLPGKQALPAQILDWWQRLCKLHRIPRWVSIGSGDRQLLLDGTSVIAVEILLTKLRKDGIIRVWESYYEPGFGLLQKRRRGFFHELVIPVFNQETVHETATLTTISDPANRWQTEQDGWLFLKIYANQPVCETLLAGTLGRFCAQLAGADQISKWFFIRYADPDPHIRLRLLVANPAKHSQRIRKRLLNVLSAELENGLVFRLQTELYEREAERYHMMRYEAIESIFHLDSIYATKILEKLKSEGMKHNRWLVVMLACDGILNAFGLQATEKIAVLEKGGTVLTKPELVYLDQLLRKNKQLVFDHMDSADHLFDLILEIRQLIDARNASLRDILASQPIQDKRQRKVFAYDLLHLCCNRLIVSDHIRQEHGIYHFLKKYYNFQLKISKTKTKNLACNQY